MKSSEKVTGVLELLQQHRALIQVLGAGSGNDRPFQEIVKKLNDPAHYRPVKAIDEAQRDRTRVYDPKVALWKDKPRDTPRGAPKQTPFTKKLSLSLLPKDGQIELYRPFNQSDTIALIYDVTLCHHKDEKYVFARDKSTNTKWWVKHRAIPEAQHPVQRSISLRELADIIEAERQQGKTPVYSDISAGVRKSALVAIACTRDDLFSRVNTLIHQWKIRDALGLDLPIVIISNQQAVAVYSSAEQDADLSAASRNQRVSALLTLYRSEASGPPLPKNKQKLAVRLRRSIPVLQNVRTIEYVYEEIKGAYLGRHEPGYSTRGAWGNDSWRTIPHFHDSDGYYARETYYREVEKESLQWISVPEDYTRFLYEWSELLTSILRCDLNVTRNILTQHYLEIDALLSGLYEIRGLLGCGDTLVEPPYLSQVDVALNQVLQILAEWGYRASTLSSHLLETANREIDQLAKLAAQSALPQILAAVEGIDIEKLEACVNLGAVLHFEKNAVETIWKNLSALKKGALSRTQTIIVDRFMTEIHPSFLLIATQRLNELLYHKIAIEPSQLEYYVDQGGVANWNAHPILLTRTWKILIALKQQDLSNRQQEIVDELLRSIPYCWQIELEYRVGELPTLATQYLQKFFKTPINTQLAQDILKFSDAESLLLLMNAYFCHSELQQDKFYQQLYPHYVQFLQRLIEVEPSILTECCNQGLFPTDPEFCEKLEASDAKILEFCRMNPRYRKNLEYLKRSPLLQNDREEWIDLSRYSVESQLCKALIYSLYRDSLQFELPKNRARIIALAELYGIGALRLAADGESIRMQLIAYENHILSTLQFVEIKEVNKHDY